MGGRTGNPDSTQGLPAATPAKPLPPPYKHTPPPPYNPTTEQAAHQPSSITGPHHQMDITARDNAYDSYNALLPDEEHYRRIQETVEQIKLAAAHYDTGR